MTGGRIPAFSFVGAGLALPALRLCSRWLSSQPAAGGPALLPFSGLPSEVRILHPERFYGAGRPVVADIQIGPRRIELV